MFSHAAFFPLIFGIYISVKLFLFEFFLCLRVLSIMKFIGNCIYFYDYINLLFVSLSFPVDFVLFERGLLALWCEHESLALLQSNYYHHRM